MITLKVPANTIKQTQRFEMPAWWEEWLIVEGSYQMIQNKDGLFVAECDAEIVQDYFQSHFGGNPFGSYDINKNKGKKGTRKIVMNIYDLMTSPYVFIEEPSYGEQLDFLIKCLEATIKNEAERLLSYLEPKSILGGGYCYLTAQELLVHSELLREAESVKSYRNYNMGVDRGYTPDKKCYYIKRDGAKQAKVVIKEAQ